MKERLYKRKSQLLEMLIQIQNELGSVNQELIKLETPVESPKPEVTTS
jgi:hypothetical protein